MIVQASCASYKGELLSATHNFAAGGDVFKIALYLASASLDASTTAYTTTGEASGAGYTAGGQILTVNTIVAADPVTGAAAYAYWTNNPSWSGVTVTAAGALIYNSSKSNKAVSVLFFGGSYGTAGGTFTVYLPTSNATTAIVRVA